MVVGKKFAICFAALLPCHEKLTIIVPGCFKTERRRGKAWSDIKWVKFIEENCFYYETRERERKSFKFWFVSGRKEEESLKFQWGKSLNNSIWKQERWGVKENRCWKSYVIKIFTKSFSDVRMSLQSVDNK